MWLLYHYCVSSDIPEGTVLPFTYLTYKQALFTVYREHLYILPTLLLTEIDIWFRFLSIPFSTLIFPTARTPIFLWTWNNTVAQSQNRFDSKHPVKCLLGQYVSSLFFEGFLGLWVGRRPLFVVLCLWLLFPLPCFFTSLSSTWYSLLWSLDLLASFQWQPSGYLPQLESVYMSRSMTIQ